MSKSDIKGCFIVFEKMSFAHYNSKDDLNIFFFFTHKGVYLSVFIYTIYLFNFVFNFITYQFFFNNVVM